MTGGAGFIGSHVVEALVARGDDTHVIDNLATGKRDNLAPDAMFHEVDVRDDLGSLVTQIAPNAIVHLAAQADVRVSVAKPSFDASVNVVGTVNVLEAARGVGAPVVFASTGGAISASARGPPARTIPASPSLPTVPPSSRARATSRRSHGFTAGPPCRCGSETCTGRGKIRTERPESSRSFSAGCSTTRRARSSATDAQTRDYVYVGDVVRTVLAALGYRSPGVFNVGRGEEVSVVELYDACRKVADRGRNRHSRLGGTGELQRSVLDLELLERELGVRPTTTSTRDCKRHGSGSSPPEVELQASRE